MGCGANLKVTAISQPTSRQDPGADSGERHFKRTHFRFKLPAEVLQGFAEVLKLVSRKTEKRKKPQFAEPSELSMDQSQHSRMTNHQSDAQEDSAVTNRDDSKSVELFAARQSPDASVVSEVPRQVQQVVAEPVFAKKATPEVPFSSKPTPEVAFVKKQTIEHPIERQKTEPKEEPFEEKNVSVEAEEIRVTKQKSIFYRVEDQKDDLSDDGKLSPREEVQESDLLSPEAPRVLPDEDFEEVNDDSGPRKAARLELERKAQEEAERIASEKRVKDEEALEEQRGKMKGMEDAAQSILSKYQCSPLGR